MPGRDIPEAELVREKGRGVELDVGVAGHAGVRGAPLLVGPDEVAHYPLVEELLEVQREVRQAHPVRRVPGEEHGVRRAARPAPLLAVVQPERDGRHVVPGLLQQQRRHGGVHPAAHRRHHAVAGPPAPPAGVALDEPLARRAGPVVLESLVQGVQHERQRVTLALGQRATERLLDVRLGDPGRVEQAPPVDELRERRPRRHASRAPEHLVATSSTTFSRIQHREPRDVPARRIARLAPAGGVLQSARVAGPHQVVDDAGVVAVSHQPSAFSLGTNGSVP